MNPVPSRNDFYYDIGRAFARSGRSQRVPSSDISFRAQRALLHDLIGSRTDHLAALEVVLQRLVPLLTSASLPSSSRQAHLLALSQQLSVSYNETATQAGMSFAEGILECYQSKSIHNISPTSANQTEKSSFPSKHFSSVLLTSVIAACLAGGAVTFLCLSGFQRQKDSSVAAKQSVADLKPGAPQPTSNLPTDVRGKTSVEIRQGELPSNQSSEALSPSLPILRPGDAQVVRVYAEGNPYTKRAEGALRYNNGNTLRGSFIVDCATGTMDPKSFTLISKSGNVIKSGEHWTPSFKTRWGAEVKFVAKVCGYQG